MDRPRLSQVGPFLVFGGISDGRDLIQGVVLFFYFDIFERF